MPKVAYSEIDRNKIKEDLIETGLELFSKQGIQHTTVEQIYTRVGISRTFFYTFFPAKEDLVVQAFYCQQPKILAYAKKLMDDQTLNWHAKINHFLHDFCYGGQGHFTIMSVEEQQSLSKCLSGEKREEFQTRRLTFFKEVLNIFEIDADTQTTKLLGNLVFSAAVLCKAIPDTLPFLFSDAADDLAEFQINHILKYMETLHQS